MTFKNNGIFWPPTLSSKLKLGVFLEPLDHVCGRTIWKPFDSIEDCVGDLNWTDLADVGLALRRRR